MAPRYPTTPMCDGALLERFEPTVRDTDVLVSTTAKCGQTWLQALLYHLKTGGRSPDFGGGGLISVSPWLELPPDSPVRSEPTDRETLLARYAALPDPRVFKLHLDWDEIPRPPGSRAKIVTITRDPRDVAYSMFSHLRGLDLPEKSEHAETFDEFFEQWMDRGFYFRFVRSFWPHRDDDGVLWLRYEDMHRDLRGHAQRLIEFLGWQTTQEDLERALPLVAFRHMQQTEEDAKRRQKSIWKAGSRFFREGAVGKNREKLSAEQERRIVERAKRELGGDCCEFVFSLPREG